MECYGCSLFENSIVTQLIVYFYYDSGNVKKLTGCSECIKNGSFLNNFILLADSLESTVSISIRIFIGKNNAERTIDYSLFHNKIKSYDSAKQILEYKKILLPFVSVMNKSQDNDLIDTCELLKDHGFVCNCKKCDLLYQLDWQSNIEIL
jgi:hypothetical protein